MMNKGMIRTISVTGVFLLSISATAAQDIWKVVDEDGNVVYTDQAPKDGSKPMDLPELSVIATDVQEKPKASDGENAAADEAAKPPTRKELSRLYRDFRITQPASEQTFWGTANPVVVAWASQTPLTPDLNVRLFVDGQARAVPAIGGVPLSLERGEHEVYAELRDAGNRRIIKTETVVFFVQQVSINSNRARPRPRGGSG